jgi:hypothetical protein
VAMTDEDGLGLARPGWLMPRQSITVHFVPEVGDPGTIVAELSAVFGHLAYGRPVGLQLVPGAGEIGGIAGVLDAVLERTGEGRILVLRLVRAHWIA